jgi:hypothetical protein
MEPAAAVICYLVFPAIMATICGFIANSKGRNVVGWACVGFFGGIIGLIICCVMPNLKDQQARDAQIAAENRRLREQLQQERIKGESFRQHAAARLDAHDQHLGLDTRTASGPALGEGESYRQLNSGPIPFDDGLGSTPQVDWYYDDGRATHGPMPATQISQLVRDGRLPQTVLVWAEHMAGWQPMSSVAEFRNR